MRKKDKFPLVLITWCDATSNENAWRTIEESFGWADNDAWLVRNVGWLLKETKEYILLSSKIGFEHEDYETQYGSLFKIPKTWIREKCLLKK